MAESGKPAARGRVAHRQRNNTAHVALDRLQQICGMIGIRTARAIWCSSVPRFLAD